MSVYLDGGPSPGGVPSTVLDLSGEEPRVVREGALSSASLLEATVSGPPSTSDR